LLIGGYFNLVEAIGYVGRVLAYDKTGELIPYMLQSVFLLLAPILFAASLYMTLGRIIQAVNGGKYSVIRLKWLTGIFVAGDVISFMIQGGGAGILTRAKSSNDKTMGENIIIGGLIFQILIFGVFCFVSLNFHLRFRRHGPQESYHDVPWQSALIVLYTTSLLIMVRNIFRVIEYAMGQNGYLLTNEWCVYVFDGTLMFFTMVLFAAWYPNRLFASKTSDSVAESNIQMEHYSMRREKFGA
jgi:hypothetical protein